MSFRDNFNDGGISLVSQMLGAAVASGLTPYIGPAGGMLVGCSVAVTVESVGNEFNERFLSNREKMRVGSFLLLTSERIKEKIDSGETLRDDDFFKKSTDRSSAEEIFEGISLAAQKEYSEKKIPFYANLYANIAFNPLISVEDANQLIRISEKLSYRQFMLIRIFVLNNNEKVMIMSRDTSKGLPPEKQAIYAELYELISLSVLHTSAACFDLGGIDPATLFSTGIGVELYNALELFRIQGKDIYPTIMAELVTNQFKNGF